MNFKNKKTIIIFCIAILGMILILKNTPVFQTWKNTNIYQMETVRSTVELMKNKYNEHPISSLIYFVITYVIATSLSIPMGNILSICAGAVFGFKFGLPIALFCTSLGATFSSIFARYLFREWAIKKVKYIFKSKYEDIHNELHNKAFLYIVGLRMTMFIPFAGLNLALGLTSVSFRKIFISTFVGQIPVAGIFVSAGTSVLSIQTFSDILTFRIALTITALAIVPLLLTRFNFKKT